MFEAGSTEKTAPMEIDKIVRQRPCHKSIGELVKLHALHFKMFLQPPFSRDLAHSDYYLFSNPKKMLDRKKNHSNEEVIVETEPHSEELEKSFYATDIAMLELTLE